MDQNHIKCAGLTVALLLLCGCGQAVKSEPKIGMANPASVYCAQQGGKSEQVTTEAGQRSNCHLPDGRVVEEWALYRASHAPTASVSSSTAAGN